MRLASALSERALLQEKILDLRNRLENNAVLQEGEKPNEDPWELLHELDSILEKYEGILAAINLTNSNTRTAEGVTVTELLSKREALEKRIDALSRMMQTASEKPHRFARNEIKWLPSVSIPELRKLKDASEKQLRVLNEQIQEINWTTELIEK